MTATRPKSMKYDGLNGNDLLLWSGADSVEDDMFNVSDELRVYFADQELTVPRGHWLHQCDDGTWEACPSSPVEGTTTTEAGQ